MVVVQTDAMRRPQQLKVARMVFQEDRDHVARAPAGAQRCCSARCRQQRGRGPASGGRRPRSAGCGFSFMPPAPPRRFSTQPRPAPRRGTAARRARCPRAAFRRKERRGKAWRCWPRLPPCARASAAGCHGAQPMQDGGRLAARHGVHRVEVAIQPVQQRLLRAWAAARTRRARARRCRQRRRRRAEAAIGAAERHADGGWPRRRRKSRAVTTSAPLPALSTTRVTRVRLRTSAWRASMERHAVLAVQDSQPVDAGGRIGRPAVGAPTVARKVGATAVPVHARSHSALMPAALMIFSSGPFSERIACWPAAVAGSGCARRVGQRAHRRSAAPRLRSPP